MFEELKKFNNIVVSGPQRSGTRISAKILAQDTGKLYIDEKDIHYYDFKLLKKYLNKGNVVIQCPGLCHILHHITNDSTLIVIVYRSNDEIISSEQRGWDEVSRNIELSKYGYTKGIISSIKYEFWEKVQKPILGDRAREINYHDLEKHPLFIIDRKNFRWDQTK